MENKKNTICVIIGTENNPEILDKCLSHLSFVDEIIITDLSNDNRIKELLSAKYPKSKHFFDTDRDLKNRILKYQEIASSDFLLILSYDEFITPALATEIQNQLKEAKHDAYTFRSLEYSYGGLLESGSYYTPRLVRKGYIYYETDNVHEENKIKSKKIKQLQNFYEHHSNPYLMVVAFKLFKFEQITAQKMSNQKLNELDLEDLSSTKLMLHGLRMMIRINVRFIKTLFGLRKKGFAGLCVAYSYLLRTIAIDVAPTNEKQFRNGSVEKNDTRGYF